MFKTWRSTEKLVKNQSINQKLIFWLGINFFETGFQSKSICTNLIKLLKIDFDILKKLGSLFHIWSIGMIFKIFLEWLNFWISWNSRLQNWLQYIFDHQKWQHWHIFVLNKMKFFVIGKSGWDSRGLEPENWRSVFVLLQTSSFVGTVTFDGLTFLNVFLTLCKFAVLFSCCFEIKIS